MHIIYKIYVNYGIGKAYNRLLVVKILGCQRLYVDF